MYPDEDSVNLSKMLKTMSYSSSQETRHAALVGVNASLEQFAPISAFSLSMVAGDWAIANKERKYTNLRSRRNTYNNVSDEVVDEMLEAFELSLARRRKAAVVEARRARDSAREMQAEAARDEDT